MLRLAVLSVLLAVASAGYLGGPAYYGAAPITTYAAHAPIAYSAPLAVAHAPLAVAHAPVATSYANTYRTVNKPVFASYAAAPVTAYAHAPLAVAHAPLAYSTPFAHTYYHK